MRLEILNVPDDQIAALAEVADRQRSESDAATPEHVREFEEKAGEVLAAMGLTSADGWQLNITDFLVRRYVVEPSDMIQ